MLVRYIMQVFGSLAIMFVVSPKLTAVLLAVVPIVAIGAQRYGKLLPFAMLTLHEGCFSKLITHAFN